MATCDTQRPVKMTDTNSVLATGDSVINVAAAKKSAGHHRASRPYTSRSSRSARAAIAQSLPEKDLLSRFRHVYAGKGGWYGHKGTKSSGPVNPGRISTGFVSKYKREILRKLSKTLQEQGSQQSPVDTENKDNNLAENVKTSQGDHKDVEELSVAVDKEEVYTVNTGIRYTSAEGNCHPLSQESSNEVSGQVLNSQVVPSTLVDHVHEAHVRPSECKDMGIESIVSRRDETCQEDLDTGNELEIDEKHGSVACQDTLFAVTVDAPNEILTKRPLNLTSTRHIETDIGSLQITVPNVDNLGGNDDLRVDFTIPHTVRSCPTNPDKVGSGGDSSKPVPRTQPTTPDNQHPSKQSDRTPRCRTLPASGKSKTYSLRSKSVKNGGSREAHNIRMTLFSRLSQEAQWAINETRRDMGVSSERDGSLRLYDDSVPSDTSDPGDQDSVKDLNIVPDPLGDSGFNGYSREQCGRQESVQPSDSPVPCKEHGAMPGRWEKKPGRSRPRTYSQETSFKDFEKSVPGLARRKAGRGRTAETQITEIPMAGGGKSTRKSTEKGNMLTSWSTRDKYNLLNSSNSRTRLPDIASELDEERERIADITKEEAVGHRIPGVGQYTIVPYPMLRRDLTFEITPPGYDCRFDGPRMDLDVEDDTPEEIKQLAIAKCNEWLTKHFVS